MKVNARFGREGATGAMTLTKEDIIDTMAVLVALRSMGDSVTPLAFLLFSTVLNVGLDLLFIIVTQRISATSSLQRVTPKSPTQPLLRPAPRPA